MSTIDENTQPYVPDLAPVPANFQQKALALAMRDFNEKFNREEKSNKFYIVWFAKALQNWKALVSTDLVSGVYFEITYDGDKQQAYVVLYDKIQNTVYRDGQ